MKGGEGRGGKGRGEKSKWRKSERRGGDEGKGEEGEGLRHAEGEESQTAGETVIHIVYSIYS